MKSNTIHQPVMLEEVIAILSPGVNRQYIDATIGGGGHTAAILDHQAAVLGFDQDPAAIDYLHQRFPNHSNLHLIEANFITLAQKAVTHGFNSIDGVLFDLGVSSLQLDTPSRGFSFNHPAPLDMRMSPANPQTAADLINSMSKDDLYEILVNNAQESLARPIAEAIADAKPVTTTTQLAEIVAKVYGHRRGHLHPATKTFQAIRIAVNQELKVIKPALKDAFALLRPGGKLVVISFHEGEDRLVKRTFSDLVTNGTAIQPGKQPLIPSSAEIAANPRARSAKLRYIERLT